MEQTLLKVKHLEKFVEKHGEDAFVSQTISKMLAYKVQQYGKQIDRLNKELRKNLMFFRGVQDRQTRR